MPHSELPPDVARELMAGLDRMTPVPTVDEKSALQARLHEAMSASAPSVARMASHRTRAWMRPVFAVASAALVLAGVTYAAMHRTAAPRGAERVYATKAGERATVTLTDGSVVVLGPRSTLRYTAPFGAADRNVRLEGEAYFTVEHAAQRPFVVLTAHTATQVLGTRFVVTALGDARDARIAVVDGKVAFRPRVARPGSGMTLVHGDVATMDTSGLLTVARGVATEQYTGWTQGRLVFTHARLTDVAAELERWYDVKVGLADPALGASWITLTIDTTSLDQALSLLSGVSNLQWTRHGTTVVVTPSRAPSNRTSSHTSR